MKIKSLLKKWSKKGKKTNEEVGRKLLLEQLEPRILYSGTVAPDAADDDQPAQEAAPFEGNQPEAVGADGASVRSVILLNPEMLDQTGGGLNQELTEEVLDAAADRWRVSGILTDEQEDSLNQFSIEVADLEGDLLLSVFEDNATILLDIDAVGREWFVDGAPLDDSEFSERVRLNGFRTISGAAVAGVDELTALMESQSQLLGMSEDAGLRDVSVTGLQEGLRRILFADESLTNPDVVTTQLVADLADAAEAQWLDAGQIAALNVIGNKIVELDGSTPGYPEGSNIYIDDDAGGREWFVDSTPRESSEMETFSSLPVLIQLPEVE